MHLWHRWATVLDTGKTVYERCTYCGKRRVRQGEGGYQPIDRGWVLTGEWTERHSGQRRVHDG